MSEILDRALDVMADAGVGGLTMAALAKAMRIQPPSLYKYYGSLGAVYDALFRRGQRANLELVSAASEGAVGLRALERALDAAGRWAVANPILAQLLFWRPVPNFRPSPDAFAPTIELVELLRAMLVEGAAAGQLHPDAASDAGLDLLATLHFGVISQHLANDPGADWQHGRYTRLHARVIQLFVSAYPPITA